MTWLPLILIGLGSAAAAGVSGRCIVSLARRPRGATAGSTTMEFTLAFPVFLVSVLVTIQTALLMHAQVVVDYAAFAAARSASVWVADLDRPQVTFDSGSAEGEAQERVLQAAVLATVPISPKLNQLNLPFNIANPLAPFAQQVEGSLLQLIARLPDAGQGVATLALDTATRWPYATWGTSVTLTAQREGCDDEPLRVTVEHRFRMGVPFAGWALARGLGGYKLFGFLGGDAILPIRASHSMRRWSCQTEA